MCRIVIEKPHKVLQALEDSKSTTSHTWEGVETYMESVRDDLKKIIGKAAPHWIGDTSDAGKSC